MSWLSTGQFSRAADALVPYYRRYAPRSVKVLEAAVRTSLSGSHRPQRIVALLAVRNEAPYMRRCLQHLCDEGIETYLIDNESTDATVSIASEFEGKGLIGVETYPYPGYFDLSGMLGRKEALARELGADWYIHQDADEVLQAPGNETLAEAIRNVDAVGFTAINFDQFVFLPTVGEQAFEGRDFVAEMRHYYLFQSRILYVRAWKNNGSRLALVASGGHQAMASLDGLSTTKFVLRHYVVLSEAHARRKYGVERRYSRREVKELRWHGPRVAWANQSPVLPDAADLKFLDPVAPRFDKTDPRSQYIFFPDG